MSKATRKTKLTPVELPEKLPEQEEDLKSFIQNVVSKSQGVLLERISGLEDYISNLEQTQAEAIETLEIKHSEAIENLRAEFLKKIAKLEEDRDSAKAKAKEQKKKHDKLEQHGRRMNIRVSKVPKLPEESSSSLKTQLVGILTNAGAVISEKDIIRHHRCGKTAQLEDSDDPTEFGPCILAVRSWDVRRSLHLARNKCRADGYGIRQDLTKKRLGLLAAARAIIDGWEIPKDDEQVYAYADINCDLVVRRGKLFKGFATTSEMKAAVNSLKPPN